ncbi:MAG: KpsF/GutQ family sugar-phosphate isomerase [Candidatus Kapabacteria bacterium]|nr:KpsF/GutQ family sugar-phosphate isomerase [Ignavibacteriota bacterium]MCW5884367.1 KpsF/GutQ family sugar-phosphate isomerase [Candidatus Kapabacteria bacterium]
MNISEIIDYGRNALQDEIVAIQNASNRLDDGFANAAVMLANANKIVISGVGKSGLIARKIAATFSSIGISAIFLHPVEALHGDIGVVQDRDVSILISKSGTTDELVKLLPYLKMRNSRIISITGNLNSALARYSDIALDGSVEKEACPFNLAPTASTTLALAIGDALAVAVMKINGVSLNDFSRLHPLGQIGRNVSVKVCDIMHIDKALPVCSQGASFRDAVIEISRKDLGCVCVTNDNLLLLGIITDGDVRRILQNSEDMRGIMVNDVMTKSPVTINSDAYLHEALAIMENRESEISVLPVVNEDNILIGVIRLHDIVQSGS